MEKNLNTDKTALAIATYKPKAGKDQALYELVQKHLPALRELQLATDRHNFIAKSENGTIIEVFEWTSMNAIKAAHQHPAVIDIWEKIRVAACFVGFQCCVRIQSRFSVVFQAFVEKSGVVVSTQKLGQTRRRLKALLRTRADHQRTRFAAFCGDQ